MTYTDVFGSATLPPAEYGYASFTLTTNTIFVWPYNTDGSSYPVAKVMDIACDAGNEITLPDCTEVSTGEDFLIRNVGANVLIVKDAAGVQVASVAVGAASYFYLTDNTTAAGVFGVIGFGVGTSTADASSLVGYGIKAVGASLNQAHPVEPTNTGITLSADHRAKLIVFTGGVATFALDTAATLGDDYFTMFRNDGTGTATIDPAASELIDGMVSMQVQPGESLMLICTGTKWYSVGYGRSTLYQFTQLTKDVSAGGTVTLSATEAANKLITFIGNPSTAVEVVVPAVVAVYYTQSAISTAQTITLKTSAGSGVGINQGTRVIALCDGTNVVSAQSAVANTSVSLTDGSALVPSLFFATQTNTGLFKSGTQDVGVTVNGSTVGVFGSTGLQTATIGPNSTQRHTLPAVPSDTVTLNTATQTLTNKTISVGSNTVSGLAVSSFALTDASGNLDGLAAAKAVPAGVVVGTTDAQTLTNKTLTAPAINSPTGITKDDVGLGKVDNTSDADKPISTATQEALDTQQNSLLSSSGSTLVGYLPAGTGAAVRNVQAKLREFVSVKDFGAVGDGVADDTSAVAAAMAAGVPLDWGWHTYRVTGQISHTLTAPLSWRSAGAKIVCDSAAMIQRVLSITSAGFDVSIVGKLTIDANNKSFTGFFCNNTGAYADFTAEHLTVLNCYRASTAFSGGDGLWIRGAWANIYLERPTVKNVVMAAGAGIVGSQGVSGITISAAGAGLSPREVTIVHPHIENISSEDAAYTYDMDGLRVFTEEDVPGVGVPYSSHFTAIGGRYVNCWGRSIKSQMEFGSVRDAFFKRTTGNSSGVGNSEIEFQVGGGFVSNIECLYVNNVPSSVVQFNGTQQADKSVTGGGSLTGAKIVTSGSSIINQVVAFAPYLSSKLTVNISDVQAFGLINKLVSGATSVTGGSRTYINVKNFQGPLSSALASVSADGTAYLNVSNAINTSGTNVMLEDTSTGTVYTNADGGCIGFSSNDKLTDAAGDLVQRVHALVPVGATVSGQMKFVTEQLSDGEIFQFPPSFYNQNAGMLLISIGSAASSQGLFSCDSTGVNVMAAGAGFAVGTTSEPASGTYRLWSGASGPSISNRSGSARVMTAWMLG